MEDSDGFTRVRRRGGRPPPTPSAAPGLCTQPTMGLKALKKSIRQHLEELSPAFQSSALASVAPRPLLEESGPGDCGELPAGGGAPLVCYGLGSPSCAAGSRLQTALLLLLRQRLVAVPVGAGGVRAARRGRVASRGMLLSGRVGATGPRHPGLLDGRGRRRGV